LPTSSFRDFERVCKSLGLVSSSSKKGTVWAGFNRLTGSPVFLSVHMHAGGRDISTGLFDSYIKALGFKNTKEFDDYLNSL
jgi:hypothetical protein